MTFSIIILGVLLILSIFGVGEGTARKLGLGKKWLIILLVSTLILYFVPNIKIRGITFTWVGFAFPIIFTTMVLLGTKRLKQFLTIFISTLVSFSLSIVYDLITFDVYESNIFQPYIMLGIIIGITSLIICKNPKRAYASNVIGLLLSELFFYISRYSIYGEYYMVFGSEKVFCCLLTSFVFSVISHKVVLKIKAIAMQKRLAKLENKQTLQA